MRILLQTFLLSLVLSKTVNGQAENWTHFRGSNLDGISYSKGIPVKWSDSTGIAWKIALPGKGWSSPVVYENQVWVTTSEDEGKKLYAICYELTSGKELKKILLFEPSGKLSKHGLNSWATPTPCIEKGFVYVHFGTFGTACIKSTSGDIAWKRTDLNCEHVQGPASSPVIYKNLLILHIEGSDIQYITALDKATGKAVWKTERPLEVYSKLKPISKKAYITPLIINVKGRDLLISNGSAACIAYNPMTGEEVWRVVQGEDSTISMPFFDAGLIFFHTGYVTPPGGENYSEILAVDPSGKGDITASGVKWRIKTPVLQLLTPVAKDGIIYTVDTKNNFMLIESKTGKIIWQKRMNAKYNSSPLWINGLIYLTSVNGETTVLKAGTDPQVISVNKITGETYATAAVSGKRLIIRTGSLLYCISE
jgi:outer membrane protein assembly factor BamB